MASLYDIFLRHPTISTDSRHISAGSLFFALKGVSFDGNLYARAALDAGAAYAVVDNDQVLVEEYSDRMLLVDDVLSALQALAAVHRRALGIPVLAITGSNGKTTTKELAYRVLACKYTVAVTRGNLNNHIGVPLTLLSIGRDAEFAIIEMGASSCGEIELLCNIAQPNFGLITNIGRAHLDGFGGVEGVKRGKGELFDYLLAHGGMAFYMADNECLGSMVRSRCGLASHGYHVECAEGLRNHLVGDYNRYNIAAAVAIGEYFEVPHSDIAHAIASYVPDNNRSQRLVSQYNTVIMDCYNANPSSMRAAIENFVAESTLVSAPSDNRTFDRVLTKVVILGDMLELGQYAPQEHLSILKYVMDQNIQHIYLVGELFTAAAATIAATSASDNSSVESPHCPTESPHRPTELPHCYDSVAALSQYLAGHPLRDSLVLVKGSHSIGLESVKQVL